VRLLRAVTINTVVAVFFALDAVLIIAAIHHATGSAAAGPMLSGLTKSPASIAASPTTSTSVSNPPAPAVVPPLLSFSTASDGWRAEAGCTRAARLAETTDAGRSWHRLAAPARHVFRIAMTSPTAGWLVGANATCTPLFYSTADGGKTWSAATGLGQAWVVMSHRLRLPSGSFAAPCGQGNAVGGVTAAGTEVALVVCGNGLFTTSDGGVMWAATAPLPQGGQPVAAALVPGSAGQGVALVKGVAGCSGLEVARTGDAGRSWKAGRCLGSLSAPVAVSLAPDGGGVAIGVHGAARTTDAGATWA
jgi:hypothetical protein